MSGIEVVALVTGIVSAFVGAASSLNERKKSSTEKSNKKTEKRSRKLTKLHDAVVAAPPRIQQEYDDSYQRIGPIFAAGDHTAQTQLTQILMDLLNVQQRLMKLKSEVFLNVEENASLLTVMEQLKMDSVSALAQQYQRLSAARMVPKVPLTHRIEEVDESYDEVGSCHNSQGSSQSGRSRTNTFRMDSGQMPRDGRYRGCLEYGGDHRRREKDICMVPSSWRYAQPLMCREYFCHKSEYTQDPRLDLLALDAMFYGERIWEDGHYTVITPNW